MPGSSAREIVKNIPSIRMGEMEVCCDSRLRSLLGSCIGVALYDTKLKVGGLAHIVLPCSRDSEDRPGKYVDTAIPLLVKQVEQLSPGRPKLHAKIAGGANMFATKTVDTIGEQNVAAIESILAEMRIPILARDCGGTKGRRMTLDTSNGQVQIEVVGCDPITL